MPPKNAQKGGGSASKKTEAKKKDKVIEDKTFGLKNKKGSKQQKFIQQVEKQVKSGGTRPNMDKERDEAQKKKDEKRKQMDELNDLFRPVQIIGSKGGDPKSILCAFYKQGQCGKGAKCKFSHDLGVERKAEKRSAFVDARKKDETSEDWDLDTLNEAINKKHGAEKKQTTTEIVCKHFLDAVENGKYGWFWDCPNGQTCKYRHALPPGFILKKDRKKMGAQTEEISLDDLIERERAALGHDTTRVTLETFLAWKKKKIKEKEESAKKEADKKKKKFDKGESGLSGREMFTFNPELEGVMEDGDDAFDIRNMNREEVDGDEEEPEEHFKEIDMNALMSEMLNEKKDEGKATVANPDRFNQYKTELAMEGKVIKEESGISLSNGTTCEGAEGGEVDIDEDLFGGDDEDLDDLEEQLEDMNIN